MIPSRGRELFARGRKLILFFVAIAKLLPASFLEWLFMRFRSISGTKGVLLRYVLLKCIAEECGDNVSIHSDAFVFAPRKLRVGTNVSIHPMCYLDSSGGIEIGDDVSIAHATTIMSTSHTFQDNSVPIKDQPVEGKRTKIRSNVWIGARSVILAGVEIEEGCIIAAGAVVTKNVSQNSIVGGVPANLIKKRT